MAEDAAKSHSLEYAKLSSEKKTLEDDLQQTQDSLRMCQHAAEEVESLRLQNARTLILKSNLENQLLALENTKCNQDNEITTLKKENNMLQGNIQKMQKKLEKLEKEIKKEKRDAFTQTMLEPKVDKAKVRKLLEELWHCVEPLSQTTEILDLNVTTDIQHLSTLSRVRLRSQTLAASPCRTKIPQSAPSTCFDKANSDDAADDDDGDGGGGGGDVDGDDDEDNDDGVDDDHSSDRDCWRNSTDLWDVLDCFRPLPAALSPVPHSNESTEMNGDPSMSGIKESSLSNDKDGEQSTKSTEPDPLEDNSICFVSDNGEVPGTPVNSSHGSLLQSNLSSMEMPVLPHDTANTVTNSFLSESQDMEVEESSQVKEIYEDMPCAATATNLQNGHERECVTVKTDGIAVPAETQLNTVENHVSAHLQSVDSELANASCNEVISKGSDPGQQLITPIDKCLDTDDASFECNSGDVTANVTEESPVFPLNQDSETVSEKTVEVIQNSLTPEATTQEGDSKTSGNENSADEPEHDSTSTKINGVSFVESSNHEELSDDEEFSGLKRKVRGIFAKPGTKSLPENLCRVASCVQSVEKQNSEDTIQKTKSETEEDGHLELSKTVSIPENENNGSSLQDKSITEHTCDPQMPQNCVHQEAAPAQKDEDELVDHPQKSLQIIDAHEVNTVSEDHDAKAEDSGVNPQGVCSVVLNPVKLSDVDNEVSLSPLTAFASRDVLASTPSPKSIGHVRTEMGPPLPPAVMPLTATPPKFVKSHTLISPSCQLPAWLPSEGPLSYDQQRAVSSLDPSLQDEAKRSPCLTTPSPSSGVPSSPLQFGSATPKHAVPVPGRLPSSALNSSPTTSQENSMQMLDTMYPELSAQARTLNILRGNVTLGRAGSESGASPPSVNQISGNKTINSSSTAFTKTEQKTKRAGVNMLLPKSAKKLRLDACSPVPGNITSPVAVNSDQPTEVIQSSESHPTNSLPDSNQEQRTESKPETKPNEKDSQISEAIEKLQKSCFDVLPVIKSHMFIGRISEVPVLRDEEKSVISDFCSNQNSAEEFMSALLNKLKAQKAVLKQESLQSICRVYVGLCRQKGDIHKAQALAYSVLKENFPEAPKMILFMVTTWPSMLSYENPLCKAIHTVSKLKAEGEILDCLTVYLHWDKTPPGGIHQMISSTLKALLEDGNLRFQKHDRHGDDLCSTAWEYIFALDLLCSHLGWKWTHDNIIGKELWPVMNQWVSQPRLQQTPIRDVSVAAVLRLIGKLSQLGIKEKLCKSVENVAKAMNLFARHGITEGVPWEVQLSAVYTIYDLAPIDPKEALEALASWRGETTQPVPSGVTSCIMQIGSLCRQLRQ
ncbi:hypothetical protein NFI96_032083 [Prochilodus magdalenae]|nr:hypothetical protein NFI96_032083 [Prochilodus magdalenae]